MSSIETFAEYIAGNEAKPDAALLRLHVADTLVAWAAGATTPEGRLLIAHRAALPARRSP